MAVAVASGVLVWLSFPPYDLWWAAPLGVAALTLLARGRRPRAAFGYGLVSGLAMFLPLLSWSRLVGGDAWWALSALQALFIGVLAAACSRLACRRGWPVWVAGAWVAQEAVRGRIPFGGFTWGRLAFGQTSGPLLDLAAIGGAPLMSFVTALGGASIAAAALAARRRDVRSVVRVTVAGAAVAAAVSAWTPPLPKAPRMATVAAVQGNVPRLGLDAFAQRRAVLDNHAGATQRLAGDVNAGRSPRPDLVLWPENSSDLDPYRDPEAAQIIQQAVEAIGVPTLIGAVVEAGPGRVRNSGIVWDPRTGPGDVYVKQHPVPFAEYVPFRAQLTRLIGRFALVPRDFVKGDSPGLLRVGPARIGDVICFEIAYDPLVRTTVRRGAELLVVQTNNASFGRSSQTEQQLAMSRLRAVEHGRDVIVVATSGVSAVINPRGEVTQRADVFTDKTLTTRAGLRTQLTVADRLGGAAELILAALAALPWAYSAGCRWRRRPAREVPVTG